MARKIEEIAREIARRHLGPHWSIKEEGRRKKESSFQAMRPMLRFLKPGLSTPAICSATELSVMTTTDPFYAGLLLSSDQVNKRMRQLLE